MRVLRTIIFSAFIFAIALPKAQASNELQVVQRALQENSFVEGRATAKGTILTLWLDRNFLSSKLPTGLELQTFEQTPANLHPVGMFIGQHLNLRAKLGQGFELPIKNSYDEVTFGISNVRIKGSHSNQTYTYLAHLRLDSWQAIAMGWLYGFPKKFAHFERSGDLVRAHKATAPPCSNHGCKPSIVTMKLSFEHTWNFSKPI